MSIASIILIIYLFYIHQNKNRKDTLLDVIILLIIFSMFINIGSFISLGPIILDFDEFLVIVVAIKLIIEILNGIKLKSKAIIYGYILLIVIFLSLIFTNLFPYNELVLIPGKSPGLAYGKGDGYGYPRFNSYSVRYYLRIIIMTLTCIVLRQLLTSKDLYVISLRIINFAKYYFILCLIEFIGKNIIGYNFIGILSGFLFNEKSLHLIKRGNFYALNGLKYEPAQFAEGLWVFGLMLLLSTCNGKLKRSMLIITLILLLLSSSLKGFIFIIALTLIHILTSRIKMRSIILLIMISTCLILLCTISIDLSYYLERINNIIKILFNYNRLNIEYNSENLRMMTIIESFRIFISRPLFGIGIGTTYAFGFLPTILSNIGFIGLILWGNFIFYVTRLTLNRRNSLIIIIILSMYIANGSIATMYNMAIIFIIFLLADKQKYYRRME